MNAEKGDAYPAMESGVDLDESGILSATAAPTFVESESQRDGNRDRAESPSARSGSGSGGGSRGGAGVEGGSRLATASTSGVVLSRSVEFGVSSSTKSPSDRMLRVVMDRSMPVMNGLESTRLIREQFGDRVVIVGVTGDALPADLREFKDAGLDDVFPKPMSAAEIASVL